jgi:ribonuclease D
MTLFAQEGAVLEGDLSPEYETAFRGAELVAWDIETSGLDYRTARIGTCQIYAPTVGPVVVKVRDQVPERMRALLETPSVQKVFHHAPFDLRFMRHHWGVRARNVACTKIMSKILSPELESSEHSLKPLVLRELGVSLDKTERVSDWLADELTGSQLAYATGDVLYLTELYEKLLTRAAYEGVAELVEASFDYLPMRIETDIREVGDVYAY